MKTLAGKRYRMPRVRACVRAYYYIYLLITRLVLLSVFFVVVGVECEREFCSVWNWNSLGFRVSALYKPIHVSQIEAFYGPIFKCES